MSDIKLNFDDIALIRAYNRMGRDSEDKINRLVAPLGSLISEHGIGFGKTSHQTSLYKAMKRSVIYRTLFDPATCQYPYIYAGISNSKICIWLETAPTFAKKPVIRSVIQSLLPSLKQRNPDWRTNDKPDWWDIDLVMPLTTLLAAVDQVSEFESFFRSALEDLRETGVVEQLREVLAE